MKLNRAQLLALNLDSHIVVDAGAGTGKTSTIIDRVIEHYLSEDQRATRILPRPERPFELSGGMLFPLLCLTAISAIILGMGMTTTAVYITVAALIVPSLIQSGILPVAAHMLLFILVLFQL